MKIASFFLLIIVFSVGSVYAGSNYTGTIKAVVCHAPELTNVCQIQLNGAVENETCSSSYPWKYSFVGTTDEGRNMLSILLAAQMAGKTVVMQGTGCSISPVSENLRHVYIYTGE